MVEISIGTIITGIAIAIIIALLTYLTKEIRRLINLIQRHEKVLFGDIDIQDWDGLIKICLSNKKYSISDRRAFIALVSILCKNKVIEMDDELRDSIETLKKES